MVISKAVFKSMRHSTWLSQAEPRVTHFLPQQLGTGCASGLPPAQGPYVSSLGTYSAHCVPWAGGALLMGLVPLSEETAVSPPCEDTEKTTTYKPEGEPLQNLTTLAP